MIAGDAEIISLGRDGIVLGSSVVVHPGSRIVRKSLGRILIGNHTIVEECVIIHDGQEDMEIGSHCTLKSESKFKGLALGDGSILGVKSTIHSGCRIGSNCVIGPRMTLPSGSMVPDHTLLYKSHTTRTTRPNSNTDHVTYLQEILPKYHSIVKPL